MASTAATWNRLRRSVTANPGRYAAASAVVGTFYVLAAERADDEAAAGERNVGSSP
jgi:hypothetical protein